MIKTQLTVLLAQKLRKIQLTPPVAEVVLEHGEEGTAGEGQLSQRETTYLT